MDNISVKLTAKEHAALKQLVKKTEARGKSEAIRLAIKEALERRTQAVAK